MSRARPDPHPAHRDATRGRRGLRGALPITAGRIGEPEDVAGPALFLASDAVALVNGVLLYVNGGQMA